MPRNYSKLIRVFEDRPAYGLGVRAYVADSLFVQQWIDHSEAVAERDPLKGRILARTAVRLSRRNGARCLRVQGMALYSFTLRNVGLGAQSERFLPFAYGLARDEGCAHCVALLNRQLALLRTSQRRLEEALAFAESSVRESPDSVSLGRSLWCRAFVRFYSASYDQAARDFMNALDLLPERKRIIALHGYAFSLAYSQDGDLLQKAGEVAEEVENELRDVRGQSIFRAKLDWLRGSVAARMAQDEADLTRWQRYRYQREAAHHLGKALRKLVKHRHKGGKLAGLPALPLEIAACAADLAAVEARANRYKVPDVFAVALDAWPAELSRIREGVEQWAEARKPGAAAQMWAALRKLRDLTVEMGCAPPLVPYLDPAAAL